MAAGSHGKTPGFLRDCSVSRQAAKMQDAQDLCFGPYRLDLQTRQLWRGTGEDETNAQSSVRAVSLGHTTRAGGDERRIFSDRVVR